MQGYENTEKEAGITRNKPALKVHFLNPKNQEYAQMHS